MKLNFQPKLQYDAGSIFSGISAGSGLIGGIIDAVTANTRMKEAEGFSDQQALTQRKWAIEDRDWQANYNSPVNIMARYKAAGLNPNLIYGNNGFSAPATRSTPAAQPYIAQPGIGKAIGDSLQNYQDMQLKQAQTENATQMLQNLKQENLNKQADLVRKTIDNVMAGLDMNVKQWDVKNYLSPDQAEARAMSNYQVETSRGIAASNTAELGDENVQAARRNNAIGAALQEASVTVGLQKAIQSIQGSVKNEKIIANLDILKSKLLNDVDLQRLDIDMQNGGINAKSPFYQKIMSGLIDGVMMYLGGKMNPGIPVDINTQRPQFNPGATPSPGGSYKPPNSGFEGSAIRQHYKNAYGY